MRRLAVLTTAVLLGVSGCGGSGDGAGDQAQFCERLDRLTRNDPFSGFGDAASAADIEVAFQALQERAGELVDVAPPDVRAAALDYAEAVDALDSLLADTGYSPTGVDTRSYRNEQVAYAEASKRLERYLTAEC